MYLERQATSGCSAVRLSHPPQATVGWGDRPGRSQVQEKSWAKLVTQGRCGKQIDTSAPLEAPEALCRNNAVR